MLSNFQTCSKGTMDPEGALLLTFFTLVYAYDKPSLPPVHKYSLLRSTAHRAAAARCAGRWATRTAPAVYY